VGCLVAEEEEEALKNRRSVERRRRRRRRSRPSSRWGKEERIKSAVISRYCKIV
jgi:hypothetical protein